LIEKTFDVTFIADQALHEKQIQQNYRPIIAVHKWFAEGPGPSSADSSYRNSLTPL
jgi:putative DNA methylase